MIKKIFIGLGALVLLLVIAVAVIPFFIDANKFKPDIEKAVVDNLNADFEIGNIKLSLWGGINLKIDKMILSSKGSHGKEGVFSMKDASLVLPYSSIFGGRPDITLAVSNPEINIITGPDGKMNVMKLMKPGGTAAPAKKEESSGKPGAAAALAFDLSFHIENGHVVYADEKKHTRTDLTGMNLDIKRFGINQYFDFSFKTELKAQEMKDLTLRGPVVLTGKSGIFVKADGLQKIDVKCDVDLAGLTLKFADLFNKEAGVALKVETDLSTTDKDLSLTSLKFIANDAVVTMTGKVNDYSNPVLDLDLQSGKFVFEHWTKILKPLGDFDMKGTAQLAVKLRGLASKMGFGGKVTVADMSLRAPGVVPRVTDVKAVLEFNNDSVTLSNAGSHGLLL